MQKSVLKFTTFFLLILLAKRQESFFFFSWSSEMETFSRESSCNIFNFFPLMEKVVINYYNIPEVAYRDKLF